jgi:hypothetical protein
VFVGQTDSDTDEDSSRCTGDEGEEEVELVVENDGAGAGTGAGEGEGEVVVVEVGGYKSGVGGGVNSTTCFHFDGADKVLVGHSSGKTEACDHGADEEVVRSMLGNSVAFVVKGLCYLVVQVGVVSFSLGDGEIPEYLASPVGCNDAPCPVLVTNQALYFVDVEHLCLRRLPRDHLTATATAGVTDGGGGSKDQGEVVGTVGPDTNVSDPVTSWVSWETAGYKYFMDTSESFPHAQVDSCKWILVLV